MRVRHRVGDLEIEEDVAYQRAEWTVQRIGWLLMALVVLAAALGFAGTGPVSRRSLVAPGGNLRLGYERFIRRNAPALLTVHVPPGHDRVWMRQSFLGTIRLIGIEPEPAAAIPAGDHLVYRFTTRHPDSGFDLVIRFEPESVGGNRGAIGVPGGDSLTFRQFVYP